MHVKMMLVLMAYSTTMRYCILSAETDGMDVCENWEVRLVGALGEHSGRLEVCCDEQTVKWCTVEWCDYWNSSDASASVVCRQMGFSQFNAAAEPSSEIDDPQHSRSVYCEGTESKLRECNFSQSCSGSGRAVQVNCQPHSTTTPNCNAVGGTLGTLVILLVLLLSGMVAALVYFFRKEFKFDCKLRAKTPRAQPEQKGNQEVPHEHILHNPVYASGVVGAHTRSTDAVTPCQYSVLGPENVGSDIARPNPSQKFRYTK